MIVIIFGVSGAGKTTLGQLLAKELGWKFYDADDFHSQSNVEKMRAGVVLRDEDRRPWLESLRELIATTLTTKENAVMACSALKRSYRRCLQVNEEVKFVYLRGDYAQVNEQLRNRDGHFMNPDLLRSQFATLEEPASGEGAIVIELGRSSSELVEEIKTKLSLKK